MILRAGPLGRYQDDRYLHRSSPATRPRRWRPLLDPLCCVSLLVVVAVGLVGGLSLRGGCRRLVRRMNCSSPNGLFWGGLPCHLFHDYRRVRHRLCRGFRCPFRCSRPLRGAPLRWEVRWWGVRWSVRLSLSGVSRRFLSSRYRLRR